MNSIRVGIIGVGNCASSLIQGVELHRKDKARGSDGLMYEKIGGYSVSDIEFSCAYDVDRRKVGKSIGDAIYAPPNCTMKLINEVHNKVRVKMGCVLDGVSVEMQGASHDKNFEVSNEREADRDSVISELKCTKTDILVNYLPVGSQKATEFYSDCALSAGVGFINAIPVFIASSPSWAERFADAGVPLIGDDVKAQFGATILHRSLASLCGIRGVKILRTYQLNTGGNTDFLNMQNISRLESKKKSKTEAVTSILDYELPSGSVHIGPSDYVPWQKDRKVCFIRIEGELFCGTPFDLEVRLSVEDSPNSAGVVIDAIRCCKLALLKGVGGVLDQPSSFYCKRPPVQKCDSLAADELKNFIAQHS